MSDKLLNKKRIDYTAQEFQEKKERLITEIQTRVIEKHLGETGTNDIQTLVLIEVGEQLALQTEILRQIAKVEPVVKVTPWYKKLGL